jgi:hypothetical protein
MAMAMARGAREKYVTQSMRQYAGVVIGDLLCWAFFRCRKAIRNAANSR